MNSNFLKKIKHKIAIKRDEFGWIERKSTIKIWEFFLLIFGCYAKEIFETFCATLSLSQILKLFKTDPINWIIIPKFTLGFFIFIYFFIKYQKEKLTLCYILSFWFYSCGIPIIHMVTAILKIEIIFEIVKIAYYPLMLFIFFKMDSTNLDSLKLLIYEDKDLIVYRKENRVIKYPGSKISPKKLWNLFIWSVATLISGFLITKVMTEMYIAIKYSGKLPEGFKNTGKNQEKLEEKNPADIFISAIMIAPWLEEFIFRKCIMKLNNYRWWTLIVSAFIFGLIHLEQEHIEKIIPYIAPGLAYAFSTYLRKNIWYTITAHMMHNAIAFIHIFMLNP